MTTWDAHAVAEAVRRVKATTRGAALHSELKALGWWWGNTRESIDRAKARADQSPHRLRIRWLLGELFALEMAELDRLPGAGSESVCAGGGAAAGGARDARPPV